jgi:hypothetical protein
MKSIRIRCTVTLLIAMLSVLASACKLPKTPLANERVYACDDPNYQPIWYVAYINQQILVFKVGKPVREIARVDVTPDYEGEFWAGRNDLKVTLIDGRWIELNGAIQ